MVGAMEKNQPIYVADSQADSQDVDVADSEDVAASENVAVAKTSHLGKSPMVKTRPPL